MKGIKINEILGAKEFQKLVFKIEDLKFLIINKFFPNYEKWYEKNLKKSLDKRLSIAKTEEEKGLLIKDYQEQILLRRKENNSKKNRNYHISYSKPNDFIKYLEKNKKIHVNGLIKNGIVFLTGIPLLVLGSGFLDVIGYLVLSINTVSTFINIECVNLQNYNLKRINASKDKFERIAEKKLEKDTKSYGNISSLVASELKKSEFIPSPEEMIDSIKTKEELKEMRALLLNELNKLNKQNITNDIKKRRVFK